MGSAGTPDPALLAALLQSLRLPSKTGPLQAVPRVFPGGIMQNIARALATLPILAELLCGPRGADKRG